ncbi:hypothetical protein [Dictyobacter kobayashii]|uniref:Uncharacterized protein n=1 Tax=Dictyobacter kobayashii TaxID=2014872 RepID=A0A402AQW1_9CHLR|nr:hypothetical protein [Dictyobacter kobayashii]GCE21488.1 hypothetical protein KDK_52880 [Dictyobacter kobayashii]
MFQRWPYQNILIAIGICALAMYIINYTIPGVAALYTFSSECLFGLVGTCAIILGCAGLYTTWRRGY